MRESLQDRRGKAIGPNEHAGTHEGKAIVIGLSPREAQVVALYLEAARLQPVAEQMGVSIQTARKQKENAMRELGATNLAELLAPAVMHGLGESLMLGNTLTNYNAMDGAPGRPLYRRSTKNEYE
jgi:DNA-binding CsgD family transcriptional regulator